MIFIVRVSDGERLSYSHKIFINIKFCESMKSAIQKFFVIAVLFSMAMPANAQFDLKKAIGGAAKAVKAFTLTDEQMADYVGIVV